MSPAITKPEYYDDMDIDDINKAIDIVDNHIPYDEIAELEGEIAVLAEKEKQMTMEIKAQQNAVYTVNAPNFKLSYKDIENQKGLLENELKTVEEIAKSTDGEANTFGEMKELADKIANGDYADDKERAEMEKQYNTVKEKIIETTLKTAMGDDYDEMVKDQTVADILQKGDEDTLRIADILADTVAKDILTMNIDSPEGLKETQKTLTNLTDDLTAQQKKNNEQMDNIKQEILNLDFIHKEMKEKEAAADVPSAKDILTKGISDSGLLNITV
jgi:hypothetical protein